MPCYKEKFKFIENIDIFGTNVELYYKGKGKQKTYTGGLLTIIYGLIYISFFIYIASMINYQIISCYHNIIIINCYINNYGFFACFFLFILILIDLLIYHFRGRKVIKIIYSKKEPKYEINNTYNKFEKVELNPSFQVNNLKKKNINKKGKNRKKKIEMNPIKMKIIKNNQFSNHGKKKKKRKKRIIKNGIYLSKIDSPSVDKFLKNNKKNNYYEVIKSNIIYRRQLSGEIKTINEEDINYNELHYFAAVEKDKRNIFQIFLYLLYMKIKTIEILFFRDEYSYFSLSFSFYLFEILLDITINSLLFTDDVISQKYYNSGELLLITSNMLSISSNIISYIILLFAEKLIDQNLIFEKINKEIKNKYKYYKIFLKISWFLKLKILIFYFILFFIGLFCTYYLFIFCSIYKNIQKNLTINYIIGTLWSFGFSIFICIFVTITRKISIKKRIKKLYLISQFINDKL